MNEVPNIREIQDWLISQIAELLSLEPDVIDIRESFTNYGLSSRDVVTLSGELEEFLERRLSPTLAYEYSSIFTLSQYLAKSEKNIESGSGEQISTLSANEPVAIIGMGCRFPGANDPESFWQMLSEGVDQISEVPADRWSKEDFFHPDPTVAGKAISYWGGFLDNVDQFDPFFFGISPIEAKQMDPQQRLLMELSYEALDNAGQSLEQIKGSKTGVFIGISVNEYSHFQLDPLRITSHTGTGSALSIAANRISYFYNFRGPSMAIDTACSSSLTAVHLACQSLRSGESKMALAGGVNMILSPAHSIAFTKAGVLAPDGRCKTFDAGADGYVRGEGGGIVVLKPLSTALADGDPVHAVIMGSAMVQDGRTNGLMAPSQESQEAMLKEAYRAAGVSPAAVQYIEAHGTGTLLGDSMEASAIGTVIGAAKKEGHCAIGSVKTNIGHLEAAAGMAGLMKTVLAIQQRTLPPSLHYHSPNPHVPFEELNLHVQHEKEPWPTVSGPAIAGVSSFGFGGTNVHLVIREADASQEDELETGELLAMDARCHLLTLSANAYEDLQSLAHDFQKLIVSNKNLNARDLCYAASLRRSQYDYRLALIGNSGQELADGLQAFMAEELDPNLIAVDMVPDRQPRLTFVFSGQGGQWFGMGRELMQNEAVFYQTIERIDQEIQAHFEWSLIEALLSESTESKLEEIAIIQPAIFAIQVALVDLWRSWGIIPDAVIGHSMGEVAAAHIAGVLSLDEAIQVICLRSQRLMELRGQGAMLATELTTEQAREALKGYENDVSIAANNSPTSTVLSGDPEKLGEIMDTLERKNLFCRLVKVDVASHSPQMEQLRPGLMKELADLMPQTAKIPIYSTVTGAQEDGTAFDAEYWVDNLRKPVLFTDAIGQLLESDHSLFIEMGPHPILLSSIQQSNQIHKQELILLPSMRREEPEPEIILRSLGTLYTLGFSIAWERLYPGPSKYVPLPSISWQRQRYWLDTTSFASKNNWQHVQENDLKVHPLLGDRIKLANSASSYVWQTDFDLVILRYLEDHQVEEEIVLPAAAYIEMALQAGKEANLTHSHTASDFVFNQKMSLQKGKVRSIQSLLSPAEEGNLLFSVYSQSSPKDNWTLHASATLRQKQETVDSQLRSGAPADLILQGAKSLLKGEDLYQDFQQRGIQYGPAFRSVQQVWNKENESIGHITLTQSLQYDSKDYQIHPALLDGCLQVLAANNGTSGGEDLYIPSACRQIRFFSSPSGSVWSQVSLRNGTFAGADSVEADIRLYDEDHKLIAELLGFRLQRILRRKRRQLSWEDSWLYQLKWQARRESGLPSSGSDEKKSWLIFADDTGMGEALAEQIEAVGDTCHLLRVNEMVHLREKAFLKKIETLLTEISSPLYGIVHLWSLSVSPQSLDENEAMDILGCNSVLYLIQALASRFASSPRLYLVTQGAQAVAHGESIAVEQSALWGLGKVISFELPEFKCVRIDLDPQQTRTDSVPLLHQEISRDIGEDQIAFRSGKGYMLRLLPFTEISPSGMPVVPFHADSSYLITGGLGGLGLSTAKWMVQEGARHLVLLGRSEPSLSATKVVEQMRQDGVEVVIQAADVSDAAQIKAVFEEIEKHMPPLRGLIHAAGVLDDGSLLNLNQERMKTVMAPKVEGSWNLHVGTAQLNLDFFVLFSSAVSVLGAPGQGNYAAASSYLDAMASYRRSLGLPGISINWGPWAEVGLAAEATERLEEQNASTQHLVKVINVDKGLEILELLLTESIPQVAVLPFDLKNLLALYPAAAGMPFFAEVGGRDTHVARLYARPKLRQQYVEPRNEIESKLAELWQQTLHIDRVGVKDSFFELGGDSVLAAQVLALARKAYGISINPQDAFQAFTIERLGELLEVEILKQISEMSEEEAQRLLSE